jgi:hypothetical protein
MAPFLCPEAAGAVGAETHTDEIGLTGTTVTSIRNCTSIIIIIISIRA